MPVVDETTLELSRKGDSTEADAAYATEKITAVGQTCREAVHHIEIRLVMEADPARERPAQAEASLSIDGRPVRAHVAATTMTEAIDLLVDRLNRRVRRHEDRRHRIEDRHRAGDTGEHEWRHGDAPAQRPEFVDRGADERELVKRKTFAWGPMSLDEAAFELDQLAHDFYLFEHADTGRDAVVYHGDNGRLRVLHPEPSAVSLDGVVAPIDVSSAVIGTLEIGEAQESLDSSGLRWLFLLDPDDGRGRVLYRRYDGHYGLITPA